MRCYNCDYETSNKKSMSNHLRYGCHPYKKNKLCLYCDRVLYKRHCPSEQGVFCDTQCRALWRSENLKGANSPSWKGGKTPEKIILRMSRRYKEWREVVYRRDNYTCQMCGKRGCRLVADHIKSFAHFPELRFDLTNGRTLCVGCHKKTGNYGGNTSNE